MPTMTRKAALEHMGFQTTQPPSAKEIRKRYFKLAKQHHPDKGGDAELFKALQNAYELLKQYPGLTETSISTEEPEVRSEMNHEYSKKMYEDYLQQQASDKEFLKKGILAFINIEEVNTEQWTLEQIINRFSEPFVLLITPFKNLQFEDPKQKLFVTRDIITSVVNESVHWQPYPFLDSSSEKPCFGTAVRDLCQAINTLNQSGTTIKNTAWFAQFVEDHFTNSREKNFSHMLTLLDFYATHIERIANTKLQSSIGNRVQEQEKLDAYLAKLNDQREQIVKLIHVVIDSYDKFSILFDKSVAAEPDKLFSDLSLEVAQSMTPQGTLQLDTLRQTLIENLKSWRISSLFNRSMPPQYSHPNLAHKLQQSEVLTLAEIRSALKVGLSENGNFGFAMNRYLKNISANSSSNELTTIISGIEIAQLPYARVEGQLVPFPFNSSR